MAIEHPNPTPKVNRQIIGLSGNQCAFDTCDRVIVNREHGVIVGKIAHIKARSENGPRFDPNQSPEENRSPDNL